MNDTIAITTVCGKARTDRAPMYYIRPLLDLLQAHSEHSHSFCDPEEHAPLIVWSWGYFKCVLWSLGIDTHQINPRDIAKQYFDGDLWLSDSSFFAQPSAIEARQPILYATWLLKAYVIYEMLAYYDGVIWLDCAYRVSYFNNHNIDRYIRNDNRRADVCRFVARVRQWLKHSQVVLAGEQIPKGISLDNAHNVRPIAGCFLAVRQDCRDDIWSAITNIHRELVRNKKLSTDEAVWALACREVATVQSVQQWDAALYGNDHSIQE
ncbi:MAG: hypothetical protein QXZ09_08165 [Candidatus Methanomethylicaceae archaeon]